jgi:hypothetical protein
MAIPNEKRRKPTLTCPMPSVWARASLRAIGYEEVCVCVCVCKARARSCLCACVRVYVTVVVYLCLVYDWFVCQGLSIDGHAFRLKQFSIPYWAHSILANLVLW